MRGPDGATVLRGLEHGEAGPEGEWLALAGGPVGGSRAALEAWGRAVEVLDGTGRWVALGAAPLALELGISPAVAAATAELEVLLPPLELARARVRLAARGWRQVSPGRLTGPGRARLRLRDRLLPRGWGRLPVLPFVEPSRLACEANPLRVPQEGAAWAAEVVRLGVERLGGGDPLGLRAARVRWLERRTGAGERGRWLERLGLWGAGRLAGWAAGGAAPPRGGRLVAAARLQDGPLAALRFVAVQLVAGRDDPGWG